MKYFIGYDSKSDSIKFFRFLPDISGYKEISSTKGGYKNSFCTLACSKVDRVIFLAKPGSKISGKLFELKGGYFGNCSFRSRIVADTIELFISPISYNKTFLQGLISSLHSNNQIVHSSIRLIYLIVLSGFEDLLKMALEKFGYKHWSYPTVLDPIMLAMNQKMIGMLDVFAEYL